MSGDVTDRFPPDGEPSTRDLVLQLLEQVAKLADLPGRMARVETALGIGEADTQPLSGRVNRVLVELAEFKHETRERLDDMDRELARLNRQDAGRYLRLEERIHALEHPEGAKP